MINYKKKISCLLVTLSFLVNPVTIFSTTTKSKLSYSETNKLYQEFFKKILSNIDERFEPLFQVIFTNKIPKDESQFSLENLLKNELKSIEDDTNLNCSYSHLGEFFDKAFFNEKVNFKSHKDIISTLKNKISQSFLGQQFLGQQFLELNESVKTKFQKILKYKIEKNTLDDIFNKIKPKKIIADKASYEYNNPILFALCSKKFFGSNYIQNKIVRNLIIHRISTLVDLDPEERIKYISRIVRAIAYIFNDEYRGREIRKNKEAQKYFLSILNASITSLSSILTKIDNKDNKFDKNLFSYKDFFSYLKVLINNFCWIVRIEKVSYFLSSFDRFKNYLNILNTRRTLVNQLNAIKSIEKIVTKNIKELSEYNKTRYSHYNSMERDINFILKSTPEFSVVNQNVMLLYLLGSNIKLLNIKFCEKRKLINNGEEQRNKQQKELHQFIFVVLIIVISYLNRSSFFYFFDKLENRLLGESYETISKNDLNLEEDDDEKKDDDEILTLNE